MDTTTRQAVGRKITEHRNDSIQERNTCIIAYHNKCIDGFTSAWIADKALKAQGRETLLVPMDYTYESTEDLIHLVMDKKYRTVFVVDFSLTIKVLADLRWHASETQVIVLDHHKTAFENYSPGMEVKLDSVLNTNIQEAIIHLDNDKSGAGMCWEYFYPGSPVPMLVQYVQDYDLYKFDLGDRTHWIHMALLKYQKDFKLWDSLANSLEDGTDETYKEGEVLYAQHIFKVDTIAKMAVPTTILGEPTLCVQCPGELASAVGHLLAERTGSFGAMYSIDLARGKIKWIFRSLQHYDCSAVAEGLGGGGHKCSAGVELNLWEHKVACSEEMEEGVI